MIYYRFNDKTQTFKHLPTVGFDFISTEYASPTGEVITTSMFTGQLFFTPSGIPHRMDFLEDTYLIVVSRNSRKQDRYKEDTSEHFLNISSRR